MDNNRMNTGRQMRAKIFAWTLSAALVFTLAPSDIFADTDEPDAGSPSAIEGGASGTESSPAAIEGGAPETGSSPAAVEEAPGETAKEDSASKTPSSHIPGTAPSSSPGSRLAKKFMKRHTGVRLNIDEQSEDRKDGEASGEPSDVEGMEAVEKGPDYTIFEGGGKRIIKSYLGNVRYEDGEELKDIDTAFIPVEDSEEGMKEGYAFTNASGEVDAWLPEDISEKPVIIEDTGGNARKLTMQLLTPQAEGSGEAILPEREGTPEITAVIDETKDLYGEERESITSLTYEEDIADYGYEVLSGGVKETVILSGPAVQSEITYRVEMENTKPVLTEEGGVVLVPDQDGDVTPLAYIAPPNITDSSEDAVVSYDKELACYEIIEIKDDTVGTPGGIFDLKLRVSREYLEDEERVYPVKIDPTVTLSGSGDLRSVSVSSAYPNTNFFDGGNAQAMMVGYSATYGWTRTLIKFLTVTSKARGGEVKSAILSLYGRGNAAAAPVISARKYTEAYEAINVDWAHMPPYSDEHSISFTAPAGNDKVDVNLTGMVKDWLDGSADGLYLMAANETTASGYAEFSTEATGGTGPVLSIEMEYDSDYPTKGLPPSQPDTVTVTPNHIPQNAMDEGEPELEAVALSWNGIEVDGKAPIDHIEYRIESYEVSADGYHTRSGESDVEYADTNIGNAASGSAQIDITELDTDTCYRLYIRAVDKHNRKGLGKGTILHMDDTEPAISAVSTSPSGDVYRSPSDIITVYWSGFVDNHRDTVMYAIAEDVNPQDLGASEPDDSEYIALGQSDSSGSFTLDPKSAFTESGLKAIYMTGRDEMKNMSFEPVVAYYRYDKDGPTATNGYFLAGPGSDTYSTWARGDDLSFLVAGVKDAHVGTIANSLKYAITAASAPVPAIDSGAYKGATDFSFSGDAGNQTARFMLNTDDRNLPSGPYKIHVLLSDTLGNAAYVQSITYNRHNHPMNIALKVTHDEADLDMESGTYKGDHVGVEVEATDFRIPFSSSRVELKDRFGNTAATLKTGAIITSAGKRYIDFDTTKIRNGEQHRGRLFCVVREGL
jgi:hypothetical protein